MDLAFLIGARRERLVAAAALNATTTAVGLSNIFSTAVEERLLYPGVVRVAKARFPGLPAVGYERGASLKAAVDVGFEPLAGFTVWSWKPTL